MDRIPRPCLMLITDRTRLTPNWTLAQAVAPAVTGGANLVLFRETDLPPTPRLSVARFVLDGIQDRAPMITAGDPQFTLQAGAEGVFVEDSLQAGGTRAVIGPHRILGVMLSSPDSVAGAEAAEADFGLMNLDWSVPQQAVATIQRYADSTAIPLIAGIDMSLDQSGWCLEAGAWGVAICDPGMAAYNRTEAVGAFAASIGLKGLVTK